VLPGGETGGPEEGEAAHVHGAPPRRHEPEVDGLQEGPDERAGRPRVGEFFDPLLVDLVLVLALEDRQPDVEGGETHRGETGLVHGHLGQQVLHVVLWEET